MGGERSGDSDEASAPSSSSSLPLEVRYLRQYALENNDWHEFQVIKLINWTIEPIINQKGKGASTYDVRIGGGSWKSGRSMGGCLNFIVLIKEYR